MIRAGRFGSMLVCGLVLGACASTPEPAPAVPRTARQVQALELAPPMAPSTVSRDVAGRYELELVGEGELAGQHLELELQREPEELSAACRAGLWDLEGSAEGGEHEPLAVSLMGLSDRDEEPVAIRLIASSVGAPSGDIEGTAIVEHGGVATTLQFVARRSERHTAPTELCGDLVYQRRTQYHGPERHEGVTTKRFEGCVEQVDETEAPER